MMVLPIWQVVIRLPAAVAGKSLWVPSLLLGYGLGTWLAFRADHRVGPLTVEKAWWPTQKTDIFFALVAGFGMTILASELGNIGTDFASRPVPIDDQLETENPGNPLLTALLVGLVHPIGFIMILIGITQRRFMMLRRPYLIMSIVLFIGVLGVPMPKVGQGALLVLFPAWLYGQTRHLSLAIAGYLPSGVVTGALVLGIQFDIQGFDTMRPGEAPFQPIWFTLIGAALVALGLFGLSRGLEAHD